MPVTFLRRLSYSLIDACLFALVWILIINVAKVTPPALNFMSAYSAQQYKDYIIATSLMTGVMFVMSVVMHWCFGASLGKRLLGVTTFTVNGTRMSFFDSLRRALFCYGVSLLILWPGPITAALYGERSDFVALTFLKIGLAIWLVVMLLPLAKDSSGSRFPLHEKWLGLRSVH